MQRLTIVIMMSLFPLFSIVNSAVAGSSSGQVTVITAHNGDTIIFSAGLHQNKPPCSTIGEEWAFSLSTPSGKAMYSLLLSAQAQGLSVTTYGVNDCGGGDRERPYRISIGPAL